MNRFPNEGSTQPRYPSSMNTGYREHGNAVVNNSTQRSKHVSVKIFRSCMIFCLCLGLILGVLIMFLTVKITDKLKAQDEEVNVAKSKYDVSEALLEQDNTSNEIVVEDNTKEDITKEKIEETQEEVKEEVEEEQPKEEEIVEEEKEEVVEEKDKNFDKYKQDIVSSLDKTTAFAFNLNYDESYGIDAPKTRSYNGIFVKSDDITAINGYVCTALNNTSPTDIALNTDTTLDDLSYVLFKKSNIKDIKAIAGGYEVSISIPEQNLEGSYTLIYENSQLTSMYGSLEYVDTKAVSMNKLEKKEEIDNNADLLDTNEEEKDILDEDIGELVEPNLSKSYKIVINNMQHM